MSVFNPTDCIITLGFTQDEYAQIRDICQRQGGGSTPDWARSALLRQMAQENARRGSVEGALAALETRIKLMLEGA